jgi:hypothetical protein
MNHAQYLVGYIAGAIAFAQIVPYLVSIFKGHTKPHRATFGIWTLVNILITVSYIGAGAKETIWVGLAYTVSSILIFVLSIRFGMGGLSKFDIFCMVMAAVGIIIWLITDNPVLTLYFYIGVKAFGLLQTIVKAYYYPKTENILAWTMSATASMLNLFAISNWTPQLALFPLYAMIADSLVAVMLLSANFRTDKTLKQKLSALYAV